MKMSEKFPFRYGGYLKNNYEIFFQTGKEKHIKEFHSTVNSLLYTEVDSTSKKYFVALKRKLNCCLRN